MDPHADGSTEEHPDTTVATVPSAAIAEMLVGALVDEGIPAKVSGTDGAYPSMDWAYGVQVCVPASRVAEARAVIETEPDADSELGPDPDSDPDDPGSGT